MTERQPNTHPSQAESSIPIDSTEIKPEIPYESSSLSYIELTNGPNNNSQSPSLKDANGHLPFQASISDIKYGENPLEQAAIIQKLSLESEEGEPSEEHSIDSQDILVKTERFAQRNIPILKQRKPSFSKPYYNPNTNRHNSNHYSGNFKFNRSNSQARHIYTNPKHQRQQQQLEQYNYCNKYEYKPFGDLRQDEFDYQPKKQEFINRFQPTYQVQQKPALECYNNDYLNYYIHQLTQMQQIQQMQHQAAWLNHIWANPFPYYSPQLYSCPIRLNPPPPNQVTTIPSPIFKNQSPSPIPKTFAKTCLPRFQIIINDCTLCITCCRMTRLRGDILVIPFYSTEEYLYPGIIYDQYWSTKEQVEKIIRSIKQKNMRNGEIEYHKTQMSSFKTIAFLKVARIKDDSRLTKSKDNCFLTSFNRGLHSLLSQGSNTSLNQGQPCREMVIPYTYDFGSSKQKLTKIVNLLKLQNEHGYERITINCSDIVSFRRIAESMGQVITSLGEQQLIQL